MGGGFEELWGMFGSRKAQRLELYRACAAGVKMGRPGWGKNCYAPPKPPETSWFLPKTWY